MRLSHRTSVNCLSDGDDPTVAQVILERTLSHLTAYALLGRGLISKRPNTDGCGLDEGWIFDGGLVISVRAGSQCRASSWMDLDQNACLFERS
jgi:hypothetical protein